MQAIHRCPFTFTLTIILVLFFKITVAQTQNPFVWPNGKKTAISLSFDDGRSSQVQVGTALLDQFGVKATFYVLPDAVEKNLDGWKNAVSNGHEIGNHSLNHPCSGNFPWAREKALENYTIDQMMKELTQANQAIEKLLGVSCTAFAYPCGQTFVGRGKGTQSYVPVVATLFTTGRGWLNEAANDPQFCDFAQLTGVESDGKDFEQILPLIETASKNGQWLVLAGHEMNEAGPQTTRLSMLKRLLEYANDAANGIWIAPVGTVAKYVEGKRKLK
jgi:peptidoglycan/xylan/chitin deacetylase (PgdA/CDA1 family)